MPVSGLVILTRSCKSKYVYLMIKETLTIASVDWLRQTIAHVAEAKISEN